MSLRGAGRTRGAALLVCIAVIAAGTLSATAEAKTIAPLPESSYAVQPVCPTPQTGHAGCLALQLQPKTATARAYSRPIGITRQLAATAAKVCEPARAAEGCYGLRPEDLRDAYFPGEGELPDAPEGSPQTIALVDAYNDYAAEEDLKTFAQEFGLPEITACTAEAQSDCFERVNQAGESATSALPFPHSQAELVDTEDACLTSKSKETVSERDARETDCEDAVEADGWAVEMSTDIEVARGVCQNCKIMLVEARSSAYTNLEEAEQTAVRLGATEVSDSWGGESPAGSGADFDHPGTVIAAAAGDDGYLNWTEAAEVQASKEECLREGVERRICEEVKYYSGADYPAASPDVVAVGGTKLTLEAGTRKSETVWNEDPDPNGGDEGAGGGGCSTSFSAPLWQLEVPDWADVGCGSKRAVADVAADADPYTGVAVYDSMPYLRVEEGTEGEETIVRTPLDWWPIGGTSVASPIVAAMFALAGGAQGVEYPAKTLYSHLGGSSLYDVTAGGNGKCAGIYGEGCTGSLSSSLDCGESELICNASTGYDGPTGVGAPDGLEAFRPANGEGVEEETGKEPPVKEKGEEPPVEEKREAPPIKEEKGKEPPAKEEKSQERSREEESSKLREEELRKEREHRLEAEEALRRVEETRAEEARRREAEARESETQGVGEGGSGGGSGSSKPKAEAARILSLSLARVATAAVRRPGALARQVAFAFELSGASEVEVGLARRATGRGQAKWQVLPGYSLTFAAAKGVDRRRLKSSRTLVPGRYRLTVSIKGGSSRSLAFSAG